MSGARSNTNIKFSSARCSEVKEMTNSTIKLSGTIRLRGKKCSKLSEIIKIPKV